MDQYLPRTVSVINTAKGEPKQSGSLERFFGAGNRKIYLFGDAQSGKTSELNHLAELFKKDVRKSVVQFRLCNFDGNAPLAPQLSIPEQLPDGGTLCFLLDGLDEVKEGWKNRAVAEINALSEAYAKSYFLITCRSNFKSSIRPESFLKLSLDGLDVKFVREYINQHATEPDRLFDLIVKHRYGFVRSIPFFLMEVVNFYNEKGFLPLNKTEIYDYFVDKALSVNDDKKDYSNPVVAAKEKREWLSFLEKLAFCLMDCQQQDVSLFELVDAFPDFLDTHPELIACPLLCVEGDKVSFIHNAFREYFAARCMTGMDFKGIMKIICYPNTDTLIPSWSQSVMFLLPLLNKAGSKAYNALLSWMLEHNIKMVVWYGGEYLDENIRNQVFKDVYLTKAFCSGTNLTDALMYFANSKESVDLVFSGIKDGDDRLFAYLDAADLTFRSPQEIEWLQDKLVERIKQYAEEGLDEMDGFLEDYPYKNNAFKSQHVLKPLIEMPECTKSIFLCDAVLGIINYLHLNDQYADFIFANLEQFGEGLFEAFLSFKDEANVRRALIALFTEEARFQDNALMKLYKELLKTMKSWGYDRMELSVRAILEEIRVNRLYVSEFGTLYLRDFIFENLDSTQLAEKFLEEMRAIFKERILSSDIHYRSEDYEGLSRVLRLVLIKKLCERIKQYDEEDFILSSEILLNFICSDSLLFWLYTEKNRWPLTSDIVQDSIESLFDKDKMRNEIMGILEVFAQAGTKLVYSHWMWDTHAHNSRFRSAFHFLLDFRTLWDEWCPPHWAIRTDRLPQWIDDESCSTQFVLHYLAKKKSYFLLGAIKISDEQQGVVESLVTNVIRNPERYLDKNEHELQMQEVFVVIELFKLSLSQRDLVLLLPYFDREMDIYHPDSGKRLVADYVLERVTDYELFQSALLSYVESGNRTDCVAKVAYERIISQKIRPLYSSLLPLLKSSPSYYFNNLIGLFPADRTLFDSFTAEIDDNSFLSAMPYILKDRDVPITSFVVDRLKRIAHNCENNEDRVKAYTLLASCGQDEGLAWLADNKVSTGYVNLDWCGPEYLPQIEQLFVATFEERMNEIQFSATIPSEDALKRIASESEDLRDQVGSFIREQTKVYMRFHSILERLADKIYMNYFEVHTTRKTLKESVERINTIA